MKHLLIIINPKAGKKKANKHIIKIVELFVEAGFIPVVMPTLKQGDGTYFAEKYGCQCDMVLCIGGDGTFNEVVTGIMKCGRKVPIGYIPGGTTNDFASTLGLSTDVIKDAKSVSEGKAFSMDLGRFNERYFTYVASFGAFTRSSYSTSQNVKNMLGHMAYVLDGITEVAFIKPHHAIIEMDDEVLEGDYIFGAISNATQIGGVLTLDPKQVAIDDGMFEIFLVKKPNTPLELTDIIQSIRLQKYDSELITFKKGKKFKIYADKGTEWSLDGEYQPWQEKVEIENLYHAVDIIL